MNKKIGKIDDKAVTVELYHTISKAAEEFYRMSVNIPKALLEVQQHMHGRLENALYHVYRAGNAYDAEEKLKSLSEAKTELFFEYSSIEYLVKTHAISIGAANILLATLSDAYKQASKWYNAVLKGRPE